MDQQTLILMGAATLGVLAFCAVALVFLSPSGSMSGRVQKRVQAVAQTKLRGIKGKDSAVDTSAQRRKQVQETLKELELKQKEQRAAVTMRMRIEQAGLEMDVRTFWIGSAILGLAAMAGVYLSGQPPIAALGAGIGAGLGLPRWILGFLKSRRENKFIEEFANSIDVIVRGVKSGLPLNDCLKVIATEAPDPVGEEFRTLVEGQKVGITLDQGMKRMFERMPLPEVNFFGIVLTIQAKTGGNLSEALGNLANVLRDRKRMKGKIQAMSSEAKASAGIIGSLPFAVTLLVYLSSPDYIMLLFTERMGNIMIMGGLAWMSIGIFVMRKMINFKF